MGEKTYLVPYDTLSSVMGFQGVALVPRGAPRGCVQLTENDLVDALIGFANSDAASTDCESARAVAQDLLNLAATDLAELPFAVAKRAHQCTVRMKWSFGVGTGLAWHLAGPRKPLPWVLFTAMLLSAASPSALKTVVDQTSRGQVVGRCQWSQCGRFFRVAARGPGKPAVRYCPGTDHRQNHRNETDRSQYWRARWAEKKRETAKAAKRGGAR